MLSSGLFLKAQGNATFQKVMLERLENSKVYTMQVGEIMPVSGFDYKPVATEMAFGVQMLHIAQNLEMIATRYLGAILPYDKALPDPLDKEKIIFRVGAAFDFAIKTVQAMQAADFEEEVAFFAGPKNKMQMVNLMNDHQAHHRGQCIVYLRLKGLQPPGYTGW